LTKTLKLCPRMFVVEKATDLPAPATATATDPDPTPATNLPAPAATTATGLPAPAGTGDGAPCPDAGGGPPSAGDGVGDDLGERLCHRVDDVAGLDAARRQVDRDRHALFLLVVAQQEQHGRQRHRQPQVRRDRAAGRLGQRQPHGLYLG
jgi:hypothetical protein